MAGNISFTPTETNQRSLKTSVSVPFGSLPDDEATLPGQNQKKWLLEPSSRPPIIPGPNEIGPVASYFRVHPSAEELRFETTSGSVNESNSKLQKHVYEVAIFSGTNRWVELRYPKAKGVKFMIYGKLVPAGPPYSAVITLSYDSSRNILKANAPCYGMVKVEYYAPYDLWLAVFGYSSKPTPVIIDPMNPGDPDDDVPLSGLDPMTIFGKYKTVPLGVDPDTILCSLALQPPTNNKQGQQLDPTTWSLGDSTNSQLPKLKLEIDPNDPVALKQGAGDGTPAAGCSILITPAIEPVYNVTAGYMISSQVGGSMIVQEILTFSGSGSAQLRYQPVGDLSLEVFGVFVDRNGRVLNGAKVAKPGESITVVDWNVLGQPINARYHTVRVDELILLDGTGYTIQGYGIVKATYAITQWRMEYRFEYDADEKEFKPAWMIATYKDQTATLQIQPPSLKKVK